MSFLDNMRRFFNIGAEYNSDDLTDSTSVPDPEEPVADTETTHPALPEGHSTDVEGLIELPVHPIVDPAMKARIFDGVVAIFNESLPDFLRKSVDPQRQSRLISESLDASLSEYLDSLSAEVSRYAGTMLKNAADTAKREADRLRQDMETLEQQRTSIREQQLSAERRRRALADRVHDLEAQLASAEAEREQFDLEKKSMLNKIKLADVQPAIIEDLRNEIERLKAEQPDPSEAGARAEEVARLNTELEEAHSQLDKVRAELDRTLAELKEHKEQSENTQTMFNDLQHQLIDEREARAKAEAETAEARKIFDSVVEMQNQMQQVEAVIQKRDERIARLKAANKKLREEITELKAQIADTEDIHDGGLFDLIQEEETEIHPTAEEEAALTSLEDDFECPDWFVSQPAPGEGSLRASEESFGYTPPAKKHTPDNDAQLSLF